MNFIPVGSIALATAIAKALDAAQALSPTQQRSDFLTRLQGAFYDGAPPVWILSIPTSKYAPQVVREVLVPKYQWGNSQFFAKSVSTGRAEFWDRNLVEGQLFVWSNDLDTLVRLYCPFLSGSDAGMPQWPIPFRPSASRTVVAVSKQDEESEGPGFLLRSANTDDRAPRKALPESPDLATPVNASRRVEAPSEGFPRNDEVLLTPTQQKFVDLAGEAFDGRDLSSRKPGEIYNTLIALCPAWKVKAPDPKVCKEALRKAGYVWPVSRASLRT